jgi:hypothetical protein
MMAFADRVSEARKCLRSDSRFSRISFVIILLAALALAIGKPLLIAYHRIAMVNAWQDYIGMPETGMLASAREFFGLASVPRKPLADPALLNRAFVHREALVKIRYFTKRRFSINPIRADSKESQLFSDRIASQTGQSPTATLEFDSPSAPKNIVGLTVYAPKEAMPAWEAFITNSLTPSLSR